MEERQHGQVAVVARDAPAGHEVDGVGGEVVVREHRALGSAGGARRVDDRRRLVAVDGQARHAAGARLAPRAPASSTSTTGLPAGNSAACAAVATISCGSASATMWPISRSRYSTLIGTKIDAEPHAGEEQIDELDAVRQMHRKPITMHEPAPRSACAIRFARVRSRRTSAPATPSGASTRPMAPRVRAGTGRTNRRGAWRNCSRREHLACRGQDDSRPARPPGPDSPVTHLCGIRRIESATACAEG